MHKILISVFVSWSVNADSPEFPPTTFFVPILRPNELPAKCVSFSIPSPAPPLLSLFFSRAISTTISTTKVMLRVSQTCQPIRNLHAGALVNLSLAFVGVHKLPVEGTHVISCQTSVAPPPSSTLEGIHRLTTVQATNSPASCSTCCVSNIPLHRCNIPKLFHAPHHNQSSGGGGGLPCGALCYVRGGDLPFF